MITLRRLELVRKDSPATADELANLQTQLNALPLLQSKTYPATPLPATPAGYVEIEIRGTRYVVPFYPKT